MLPEVTIYTDGACSPNPGPGGWGAVLLRPEDPKPIEMTGSEAQTTNNRMEIKAAIEALASLPEPHRIRIFTDSKYLKRGITEWLPQWRQRNWQTRDQTPVKNQDLWKALAVKLEAHQVRWQWLKGHANDKWNQKADALARGAVPRSPLPLKDENAIHMFTAVAFSPETFMGGWCVILRFRKRVRVMDGRDRNTTGNRMHLRAAIEGLAAVKKPLPIHIYTYSGYLKNGATHWVRQWAGRGWQTREGQAVRHRDLWGRLQRLTQRYRIQWFVTAKAHPPCEMQAAKLMARDLVRTPDSDS